MSVQTVAVPGCPVLLEVTRDAIGRLVRLAAGGRVYLSSPDPGVRVIGEGLLETRETARPNGFDRTVWTSSGETWVEQHRWDDAGRPNLIDGVQITRDAAGRVTRCHDTQTSPVIMQTSTAQGGQDWVYRWDGDRLAAITGPFGHRSLSPDRTGRPGRRTEGPLTEDLRYHPDGTRLGVPALPTGWHRDPGGRLQCVTSDDGPDGLDGPDGEVRAVWLWDGLSCIGRIDGRLGDPLAAAFTLDPTGTPIRLVTASGSTRLPRDAFGEGLLGRGDDVPGLQGGAVRGRFVHFRSRVLDPLTGSWCAPDPWNGGPTDPRRAGRQRVHGGRLLVERAAAGDWSVCAGDPVGRIDPTGEVSVPLVLSDLTWSLPTNLGGWLGMEFTLNFWYSLFAGTLTFEGLSASDRSGSFGVNLSGMFSTPGSLSTSPTTGFHNNLGRAWTYGHIVWDGVGAIDALTDARVYLPSGPFRPTLYASLLRIVPTGTGSPFLLAANGLTPTLPGVPLLTWTRAGGPSEPAIPGSPMPSFPSGGLHFDTIQAGLGSPAAVITELAISGGPAGGTVAGTQAAFTLTGTGLGLRTGDTVSISGAAAGPGGALFAITTAQTVSQDAGSTRVLLAAAPGLLPAGQVRVRSLAPDPPAETLNTVPAQLSRLSTAGTAKAYTNGDALRLSQAGAVVGSLSVIGFEAQITLDVALPSTAVAPFALVSGVLAGAAGPAQAAGNTLTFATPGAAGLLGAALLVTPAAGGPGIAVVISAAPTPTTRTVDRDLSALGASVSCRPITDGAALGSAAATSSTPVLTYAPTTLRSAPTGGQLIVVDAAGTRYARTVLSLGYDALALSAPLPGTQTGGYQVERFTSTAAFDHGGLSIDSVTGLTLAPASALDGAVALQLHQFAGPQASAAGGGSATAGALTGDRITFTATTGRPVVGSSPTITSAFNAGALVVLTDTASPALEPAVIAGIRLAVDLDRPLDLAADGFDVVLIQPFGELYDAQSGAAGTITALPSTGIAAGGAAAAVVLQMPRLGVGELVQVTWTVAATSGNELYRITAVDGTTLTLADGAVPIPAGATNLTVQRLIPAGATNTAQSGSIALVGGRIGVTPVGRDGQRRPVVAGPPGAGNASIDVAVWQSHQPFTGAAIAVVDRRPDGAISRPARVATFVSLQARLATAATLSAATVTVSPPALSATPNAFAASFTRTGTQVSVPSLGLAAGPNLVVAIGFTPTTLTDSGQLGSGTVLIPDDPDAIEFDRKQALVEHELQHTKQSAMWGPLLLSFIPLGLVEGLFHLGPEAPRPGFSAYVAATVPDDGSVPTLVIADPGGITFAAGDSVQVADGVGTRPTTIILGASTDGHTFSLPATTAILPGAHQIRRVVPDSAWNWVDQVARTLTSGGLLELVTGSVYSGLTVGVGELFYAGYRLFNRSKDFPATAGPDTAGGGGSGGGVTVLKLDDAAGQQALTGAGRITITGKDATTGKDGTVTRTATVSADTVTLGAAIDLTAPLRVAPYSTRNADSIWDWHTWYAASLPEPDSRPALVKVEPNGTDTPGFAVNDKVSVHLDHSTYWAHVTAVHDGDGTIELDQAPTTATDLRIAKLGSDDPLADRASWLETQLGMGWMRWAFDPYGQLAVRLPAEHGTFAGYLTQTLRYLLGSKSWGPVPFLGYWFLDNARHQFSNSAYLSAMEQNASGVSGDTYCSLATLTGGDNLVVGDVARYRTWGTGGGRVSDTAVLTQQFDAPGVMLANTSVPVPVVLPFAVPETNNLTLEPNRGAGGPVLAALPAGVSVDQIRRSVPGTLFTVQPGASLYSTTTPNGYRPAAAGWIPNSAALERTSGIYVAFSQAGKHRISVIDDVVGSTSVNVNGSAAQRSSFPNSGSTLFYDVTVADVVVTVAGQPVADGGTISLVLTQRADLVVTPGAERRYAATVLRPTSGPVLRLDATTLVAGFALATPGTPSAPEPVEVSRVYRRASDGSYDGGGVAAHGLHWPGDLHVPVRAFTVTVTDTVSLLAQADPPGAVLTAVQPGGQGFALVPAAAMSPPVIRSTAFVPPAAGPAPVAGARLPVPLLDSPAPTGAAVALVGPGLIMHAVVPVDDPPEEPVTVVLAVTVGTAAEHGDLTCTFTLNPWFRLTAAGFTIPAAAGGTLTLDCSDPSGPVTPEPTSLAVTPAAGTAPGGPPLIVTASGTTVVVTVPAGATPGRYEVTATSTADPTRHARRTIQLT